MRSLNDWLRKLIGIPARTRRRRSTAALAVERLESRDVPTTFPQLQLDDASQYMLELINRARANPAAEAARYGIDLNEGLAPGTISTDAKQPLALNPALEKAIAGHLSVWMNSTAFWSVDGGAGAPSPHTGLGDGTVGDRIAAAGYGSANWYGENLAAQWQTSAVTDLQALVDQLERGLFVDTYVTGRGHRLNLLNPNYQEVGVGVASGIKPAGQYTGSNLVLAGQDFATNDSIQAQGPPESADPTAGGFVTGAVYEDLNANGQYDMGEGIGGDTLQVAWHAVGSDGTWNADGHALVSDAGGFTTAKLAPGQWTLTISGGRLRAPETMTVTVGTANVEADFVVSADNVLPPGQPPPSITIDPASLTAAQVGTAYTATLTAAGGTGPYTFAIASGALPAGLTLTPDGTLSGTPTAGGKFAFTIRATDASDPGPLTATQRFTLTVAPPTLVGAPLQSIQVAVGVHQAIAISGGTGPYHVFRIVSGHLPAGVMLNSLGVLYGKPIAGGTFTFTIRATDSSSGTGPYTTVHAVQLTVNPPDLVIATSSLAPVPMRTAFTRTIQASGGTGARHFRIAGGALPSGVVLNPYTGTLRGRATVPGLYSFTVKMTDSSTGTGPYSITQDLQLIVQQATTLAFVSQPANSATGTLDPFQVTVLDQFGNPFTGAVSLRLFNANGTPSRFLAGSVTSVMPINGVATFSKIVLNTASYPGTATPRSYRLVAVIGTLGLASDLFTVGVSSGG
jgi:hypothetical protein